MHSGEIQRKGQISGLIYFNKMNIVFNVRILFSQPFLSEAKIVHSACGIIIIFEG